MSNGRSEAEKLARQFFRDNKKALDLIAERKSVSGFALAFRRLLGDNPQREKPFRISNYEYLYSRIDKNRVSFLPAPWAEELDKTKVVWRGCENWWSGYPFIALVELRLSDDGTTGHLKLNAEVGPISNHKVRKGIIAAINAAASAKNLERIRFPAGASDKGRLYSRFLHKNSIAVNDIRDADEMERKLVELIADFEPEFEAITGIIPQCLHLNEL